MERTLDHIKYNLVNNIEAKIEFDENDQPFVYIPDESREETAKSFLNFFCETINNYNKFVKDNRYKLRSHLEENNFPFDNPSDQDNLNKVKLCLEYYLANS